MVASGVCFEEEEGGTRSGGNHRVPLDGGGQNVLQVQVVVRTGVEVGRVRLPCYKGLVEVRDQRLGTRRTDRSVRSRRTDVDWACRGPRAFDACDGLPLASVSNRERRFRSPLPSAPSKPCCCGGIPPGADGALGGGGGSGSVSAPPASAPGAAGATPCVIHAGSVKPRPLPRPAMIADPHS
eukprot:1182770-Prorocentrum_minimum.AAC.5